MWTAVLEFFAKLGTYFLKRANNPDIQYRKEVEKNQNAVLSGDSATVNAQLESGLNSLPNKSDSNS